MEIRKYLSQARYLDASIEKKIEERERMWTLLTSARPARLNGMPRGGGSDWTDTVSTVIDLTAQINEDIRALCALKKDIHAVIDAVGDERYRKLLELRYCSNYSWRKVAEAMNYDERWVFRMHVHALRAADEARRRLGIPS